MNKKKIVIGVIGDTVIVQNESIIEHEETKGHKMIYAPHRLCDLGKLYDEIPLLQSEHTKGRRGRKRKTKKYF